MTFLRATVIVSLLLLSVVPPTLAQSQGQYNSTAPKALHHAPSTNFTQVSIDTDSQGNLHSVAVGDNGHLFYKLTDASGMILIDQTQISDTGQQKIDEPMIRLDHNDIAHVVWANHTGQHSIEYTALNPYALAMFSGSSATDASLSVINDTVVVGPRSQERGNPFLAVDSVDNLHLVWDDRYDELNKTYQSSNIYYMLLSPNIASNSLDIVIDESIIAVGPLESSSPSVVLSPLNVPTVLWQETSRQFGIEMAFVIDTSGSMYSEWADVCTFVYGGNWAAGGYTQGIKSMFNESGITIYETIYGLGNTLPSAASSGNCQNHNQNSGPRHAPLGQVPGDDSGGIRKLPGTVYQGNTYSGYSGEDWGPGSNWACLSWRDAAGNVPGNPPTADDHRWNPNATKFVIPVSDEGPKDGDPSQQADDKTSIQEAHDNCLLSGVIPLGLYGQGYGNTGDIQSHFIDLVQCPNGVVSTQTRNCPATTLANTNAGGQAYEFPTSGTSNVWGLLIEALWWNVNANSPRDVMIKIIDPYGMMSNDSSWANGSKAHAITSGQYVEDIGGFVHVQTSSLTNTSGLSNNPLNHLTGESHPQAVMDSQHRLHVSWLQSITNTSSGLTTEELQYAVVDVTTNRSDGVPEGLLFNGSRVLTPSRAINNASWAPIGSTHALAQTPNGEIHGAWLGTNSTGDSQIFYTKFDPFNTSLSLASQVHQVTNWSSEKLSNNSQVALAVRPALAKLAWDDRFDCSNVTLTNVSSICQVSFVEKGLNFDFEEEPDFPHVVYPGDVASFTLVLDTNAYGTTSLTDEHIRLRFPSAPPAWDLLIQHSNNNSSVVNNSELLVEAGSALHLDVTLTAPTIYTANASSQVEFSLEAHIVGFEEFNSTLVLSARLVVNSSINVSSNASSASMVQGGQTTIPLSVSSGSNVVETAIISWSSPTPNFPTLFDITAPMLEYLGPGEQIHRSITINTKNHTLPGIYSMVVDVTSAYISPLNASSFEFTLVVLPKLEDHAVFNVSSFNPFFEPDECRLVSIDIIKMFGDGALWLNLSGAVDGRFVHSEHDWTFDFRSLGPDNTEFRGPWSHVHRQRGDNITLELCSPSLMASVDPVIFTIVPTWDEYQTELNRVSIVVYPYQESEWIIDTDSSTLLHREVTISGSLLNNSQSGEVMFEFALNASFLDSSEIAKQSLAELGLYSSVSLSGPGLFQSQLNLSSQLDDGVEGVTTVYVKVTDSKRIRTTELVYLYSPIVDSDGDLIPDSVDAFLNIATQWSDIDGDGYGDNWGNATWNGTRGQDDIGQFVAGAVLADYCPEVAGNSTEQGYFGCPDDDGDGIPNIFDVEDVLIDGDGDGVPDEFDQCLFTLFGTEVDASGCALDLEVDDLNDEEAEGFFQSDITRTVGWGAILLAIFTFLQTNAAAAMLPDAFRWVQVFRTNTKLSKEEENELAYLQSLVQAYYLEPETLAEELREFRADVTARYTNNELKKTTQEKISVLIKDILSSSKDDLIHIANNEAYFGLNATIAIEDRKDLLMEKLAMESEPSLAVLDNLLPPQELKGELKDGFEWIEYPDGSSIWYMRDQSLNAWKKWER